MTLGSRTFREEMQDRKARSNTQVKETSTTEHILQTHLFSRHAVETFKATALMRLKKERQGEA